MRREALYNLQAAADSKSVSSTLKIVKTSYESFATALKKIIFPKCWKSIVPNFAYFQGKMWVLLNAMLSVYCSDIYAAACDLLCFFKENSEWLKNEVDDCILFWPERLLKLANFLLGPLSWAIFKGRSDCNLSSVNFVIPTRKLQNTLK